MRFVVHALDLPDALSRRMDVIEAHRAYLEEAPVRHGVRVLLSGPLMDDTMDKMIGSFFLLEAETRSQVEAFFAEDPLNAAQVWDRRTITAVHIRQNTMV